MPVKINKVKEKTIKLLRWSEKYTKTDMVYFAHNGFWLMLAQLATAVSAFVMTVLLTNILPKETFGQYRFVLSIIPMLAVFTLPGIGTALTRAVAKGAEPDLMHIVKTKIKWGLLGSISSLMLAIYYYINDNISLTHTFLATTALIPIYDSCIIYVHYYRGKLDFKTPAIYESISRLIQAAILVMVAFTTHSIPILVFTFFFSILITNAFFFYKTIRSDNKLGITRINKANKQLINYGKHLSIISLLVIVSTNIDKLIVWHMLGAEALAIYVVILLLPTQANTIIISLTSLIYSKFTQNSQLHPMSGRVPWIVSIILLASSLLLYLLAPIIHSTLFTQYTDSSQYVALAAILVLLQPIYTILMHYLTANKHKNKIYTINSLDLIITPFVFFFIYNSISTSIYSSILALITKHTIITLITLLVVAYTPAKAKQT